MITKPTKEQRQILNHQHGTALVAAGAGCGKTQTLIMAIRKALKKGIKPDEILVLTYNKSTVSDFVHRLHEVLGTKVNKIKVMTFHAFGKSIISEYWSKLGFSSVPQVKGKNHLPEKLLDHIATKHGVSSKDLKNSFNAYFNGNNTVEDYQLKKALKELIKQFQKLKLQQGVIDFNDMQLLGLNLLKDQDILQQVTGSYCYFLVDELQDINRKQAQLIQLLASNIDTTIMVGDQKQTIYGFRDASLAHWNALVQKLVPTEYSLTRSFRCPQQSMKFINAVAAAICDDKQLTSKQQGMKQGYYSFPDVDEQADFIAQKTHMLINKKGVKPSEIACISRVNSSLENLKLALDTRDVHCIESKVFEEGEGRYTKILRGTFKVIRNLLRITRHESNKNRYKVPKEAIRHIVNALRINDEDLAQNVIKKGWGFLKVPSNHQNYRYVLNIKNAVVSASTCTDVKQATQILINAVKPIINSRYKLFKKLLLRDLSSIKTVVHNTSWSDLYIPDIQAPQKLDKDDGVMLTTIHGAKGKEWKYVFLIHVVEGEFPHHKSKSDPEKLEEEKRLLYVAITRHSKKLCILQCPKYIVHYKNKGAYNKREAEQLDNESSLLSPFKPYF